jgi:hypothetical protein
MGNTPTAPVQQTPDFFPAAPARTRSQGPAPTPDFIPANQTQTPDFIPALSASAPTLAQNPKPEATGFVGKTWDWLNSPLLDLTRQGAGPIESGVEKFASGLTSPLSIGLAVGTFGSGLVEEGLVRGGLAAADAAGAVQKAKLITDFGFLAKYGYDVHANTIPQLEMNWGDYRAATNERDRTAALNRFEEQATESVLGAIAMGFATRGVAQDLSGFAARSPKGLAMANPAYADGVFEYSENSGVGRAQAAQTHEEILKAAKSESRQTAMALNLEAGGDPRLLEEQAQRLDAAGLKDWAEKYRSAKTLSDSEIAARNEASNVMAGDHEHLKAINRLPPDHELPNFLPHRYVSDEVDPVTKKPIDRPDPEGLVKKRTFPKLVDAILQGETPITNLAALVGDYHEQASNLIARHYFAEKLASSYTNDGMPMAAPGHMFPGSTRPADAPATPQDVAMWKAKGQLNNLIAQGKIYEVPAPPAMVGKPGLVVAEKPLAVYDARDLGTAPEEKAYMIRQRDYVPVPLAVWRPVSEAEAANLAPGTEIVPFGKGPFPEQAIMQAGDRGIPTDQAAAPPKVANARVPLFVSPDVAPHATAILESTRPKSPLVRAALAATREVKGDLLSLSPFHWATILNRSLEAGLNPFTGTNRKFLFVPKDIDYYNLTPAQSAALRDGVVTSYTRPGSSGYLNESAGEGLTGQGSVLNKIPLIGGLNRAIEDKLFGPHGWITSLKFDLYDKLKGELQQSKPELTDVQVGRIAASQVNNKFGGLNYTVLGRSASTQNTLRLLLLAPDFLESSGRSILDVAGDHGGQLAKMLVGFNAAHWLLVRGLNYLVSGDTHPEAGFSVMSKNGKREYSLRTTLGDFLHFAEKPRDFVSNRVNPVGRALDEAFGGEDAFGEKVSDTQRFFDVLRQITPIPLQGAYPNQSVTQPSAGDKLLQSAGVQSRKHFTPAETLAHQLGSKQSEQGAPLEGDELAAAQLRFKLEDALRTAINMHDNQDRLSAIQQIHSAAQGPDAKLSQREASELIERANKFPMAIQSSVEHLPLSAAFQVWNQASITERRALRPIIQKKIDNWMLASNRHTRQQNETVRRQVQAFRLSLAE